MKAASIGAMMVGAMIGASAVTAFGMTGRHTQRRLKKMACRTGSKMASAIGSLWG